MDDRYQLFTVDGSTTHGPYPARPVTSSWNSYGKIAVTRGVAEKIAFDLNEGDAGCGLTAEWRGADLAFVWDVRHRGDEGEETVTPGPDGLYEIGGLWPWMPWGGDDTAGQQALRALEKRGIIADYEFYDGQAWLVITVERKGDSPAEEDARCLLLALHGEDPFEDNDINRPVSQADRWRVFPDTFDTEPLIEGSADELHQCVEAIPHWFGAPQD
ncbi:hypothetical protein [Streptomyces sp. NPDC001068]|uniref:hypothetical protein n=1 Tax=Streptomyces sp. NPDC001068 TaxID=3364544 RepID=UPI00368C8DF5